VDSVNVAEVILCDASGTALLSHVPTGAKNCVGVPDRDGDEVNGNEEACPPCSQKS
jgi:hypothetical protein